MLGKMALQLFTRVFCLMIVLLCKGCHSQQPACGRPAINSRTTGGQDAAPGRWPWHAVIKFSDIGYCQGSLITNQWVLTSAFCALTSDNNETVVLLGVQNRTAFNPNEVTRTINHSLCHQNYSPYTSENNICLLKLSAPVNFTNYIQPICLASENSTFYDGTSSWVSSFGMNENYTQTDTLEEVNVPIVGNNKCNCFYEDLYFYFRATENMICAGYEDGLKGPFVKDDGAPLVTKKDSVWVQSGLVSITFGYGISRPSAYTRVSQYQKWISDRVSGMEPGFVTFTSPGKNSDSTYTCPTPEPTTTTIYTPWTYTYPTPTPYPYPRPTTDDSVFGSGENLIPFTHFLSLSVLVLVLHVFVGSGGFF